jgi:two-component system OmpR family sensor kinase
MQERETDGGFPVELRLRTLEQILGAGHASITETLESTCRILAEALAADLVQIYRHDDLASALIPEATACSLATEAAEYVRSYRVPMDERARLVSVFRTGEPVLIHHADADSDIRALFRVDLGLHSLTILPFTVAFQRQGVLLIGAVEPDRFAPEDLLFFNTITHWIGIVYACAASLGRPVPTDQGRQEAEALVTVLAHDLRNVLSPLALRLDLIRQRAQEERRPKENRDVIVAQDAVRRLTRMVDNVLIVGRLDRGTFAMQLQRTDLAPLVQETARILATPSNPVEVRAPHRLVVSADPDAIRQALENLIANAIRYSPTRVPVVVTATRAAHGGDSWVVITVRDAGPGIPEALRPQLFERFVTGGGSRGLGLGLYLARQIAEAHGGTLEIESSGDTGTAITLAWPMSGPEVNGTKEGAVW